MIFGRQVGVFKELIELVLNGRFGSLAAIKDNISLTSAFGCKADIGSSPYVVMAFAQLRHGPCQIEFKRFGL